MHIITIDWCFCLYYALLWNHVIALFQSQTFLRPEHINDGYSPNLVTKGPHKEPKHIVCKFWRLYQHDAVGGRKTYEIIDHESCLHETQTQYNNPI